MHKEFNQKVLNKLLALAIIKKTDSILVVGGLLDEKIFFQELGFKKVTISNIISQNKKNFSPFSYVIKDMEKLDFKDKSFDFVFTSRSLHHCASPVKAMLEMYRVAKKGIIFEEGRDSTLLRLGHFFKLLPQFEIMAISDNNYFNGGVNNSVIPNYSFHFTEREIEKNIKSFDPIGKQKFIYFYGFSPSFMDLKINGQSFKYAILKIISMILKPFFLLAKKQGNIFSTVVLKPVLPRDLWPWLKLEKNTVVFNKNFIKHRKNI